MVPGCQGGQVPGFRGWGDRHSQAQRRRHRPTLTGLFEAWEKDARAKGVAAKTIRDFRQKLGDFTAFVGHDQIGDMTLQGIVTWTDRLGTA
ncbi:hypothetical protein [Paracoccus sp. N5]|uniref:hypothetical protein n=1 Tax=Paracoccus sp. N5 TaxID=1101189 RepID=UPI0003A188E5|nr:hypothetical protein [Paracoccus sp. N5]